MPTPSRLCLDPFVDLSSHPTEGTTPLPSFETGVVVSNDSVLIRANITAHFTTLNVLWTIRIMLTLIVFWTIGPNEEDTTAYSPPTASHSPSPLPIIINPIASDQN